MERSGKFKFSVVSGMLPRNHVRKELKNLVADLHYHYPDSRCSLDEAKGLLESTFLFVGHDIPESTILAIDKAVKKWAKDLKEA